MDWDVFWSVLVVMFIVIPLFMIWAFAIVDLFQREDLRGIVKVAWLLFIIVLPIIGTVVYFLVRPKVPMGVASSAEFEQAQAGYVAEKLTQLLELREKGAITPEQYETQRSRLLST